MNYDYSPLPKTELPTGIWIFLALSLAFLIYITGYNVFGLFSVQLFYIWEAFAGFPAFAIPAILFYLRDRRKRRAVARFMAVNGVQVIDSPESYLAIPPVLDQIASEGFQITNAYWMQTGATMVAAYEVTTMQRAGRTTHNRLFSVLQLRLGAVFPHIFIDGRNNGLHSVYSASQRVSLEGNFDQSFSVYLPDGEQIDVLSVLAPDVLQTLVDAGSPYDIEIIGDTAYVCSNRPYYRAGPLEHVLAFAGRLQDELDHRAVSWQQPLPGVAPPPLKVRWRDNKAARAAIGTGLIAVMQLVLLLAGFFKHQ